MAFPRCSPARRATLQNSTGQTLHGMATGRELQLPSDPRLPTAAIKTLCATLFIHRKHTSLFRAQELARRHLQSAQRHQRGYFDRRQTTHVSTRRPCLAVGFCAPHPRGPYEVPPPLNRTLQR
ncbi:hypothetical protein FGIG_10003 [Fasciola gigantica]|uniref:Uncharacterized protein n=1 Tax=Fasciola gigantica TaxID=46835 RepID=A0A504Z4A3_FASGI|nr:hypothetical protein FGIG_10003 [Fasciola gigantica]